MGVARSRPSRANRIRADQDDDAVPGIEAESGSLLHGAGFQFIQIGEDPPKARCVPCSEKPAIPGVHDGAEEGLIQGVLPRFGADTNGVNPHSKGGGGLGGGEGLQRPGVAPAIGQEEDHPGGVGDVQCRMGRETEPHTQGRSFVGAPSFEGPEDLQEMGVVRGGRDPGDGLFGEGHQADSIVRPGLDETGDFFHEPHRGGSPRPGMPNPMDPERSRATTRARPSSGGRGWTLRTRGPARARIRRRRVTRRRVRGWGRRNLFRPRPSGSEGRNWGKASVVLPNRHTHQSQKGRDQRQKPGRATSIILPSPRFRPTCGSSVSSQAQSFPEFRQLRFRGRRPPEPHVFTRDEGFFQACGVQKPGAVPEIFDHLGGGDRRIGSLGSDSPESAGSEGSIGRMTSALWASVAASRWRTW